MSNNQQHVTIVLNVENQEIKINLSQHYGLLSESTINQLTDKDLDTLVAAAQGYTVHGTEVECGYTQWRKPDGSILRYVYQPSSNASQAYQIIMENNISIAPVYGDNWEATIHAGKFEKKHSARGANFILAAMRVFVVAKLLDK